MTALTDITKEAKALTKGYTPAEADARYEELQGTCSVIPMGECCYTMLGFEKGEPGQPPRMKIRPCPYLGSDPDKPKQLSGYCAKLKAGDWEEDGTLLLWDMSKECDVNIPNWEEDEVEAGVA